MQTGYYCKTNGETLTINLEGNCIIFSTENPREYEGNKWTEHIRCVVPRQEFERMMKNLSIENSSTYEMPVFSKEPPDKEHANYDLVYALSFIAEEQGVVHIKRVDKKSVKICTSKVVWDGFYGPNGGEGHSHHERGAQSHQVPYKLLEDLLSEKL